LPVAEPIRDNRGEGPAISKTVEYRIQGMDCAEEVALLRSALSRCHGVDELAFDVVRARMRVDYDPARISPAKIERAVASTGMRCEPWQAKERPRGRWDLKTVLTAASGAAVVAGMTVQGLRASNPIESLLAHHHERHDLPLPALVLFWIAMVCGAIPALPKAAASLRRLRPDMNALVVLSLIGASALGEWTEAATLSFLFALAGLIEAWSLSRARVAISRLLEITPQQATVMHAGTAHGRDDHGEHEHRVPVEEVRRGAVVRVRPGERVPFDGEVLRGTSYVNQALITGEPVAVEKRPGDSVYAGTMNENGLLDVLTTREAFDTTLARMVRMVEESQKRRAPSEQFVERFTRYYTPLVFLLAFSVAVLPPLLRGGDWGQWFYQGMVVLLISCPCALVISTPVSIVAALAAAARHGVLIKGGAFLEEAARIRAVALDKTGVLTRGEPVVRDFVPLNGRTREEVLERLAKLEVSSEHPLARAILRYAHDQGIHVMPSAGFRALQGRGAEVIEEGHRFWVGSTRMLRELGIDGQAVHMLEELAHDGRTVIACGQDFDVWALASLEDPLHDDTARVLDELRKEGVGRMVVLTGDSRASALGMAKRAGLEEVHAELLPQEKAIHVIDLLREHKHVAMVGDGVNDAQALSYASLGISLGRDGADIANETADVVLMGNDLRQLPFLIRHGRRALRIIKQNITFALATKALFLAAAMTGVATLWMAVAADMGATFAVTLNGLRLLRIRPEER
jgi:Cd2+/Zn2+-exporting ATPase